jgi:hypothetical protein
LERRRWKDHDGHNTPPEVPDEISQSCLLIERNSASKLRVERLQTFRISIHVLALTAILAQIQLEARLDIVFVTICVAPLKPPFTSVRTPLEMFLTPHTTITVTCACGVTVTAARLVSRQKVDFSGLFSGPTSIIDLKFVGLLILDQLGVINARAYVEVLGTCAQRAHERLLRRRNAEKYRKAHHRSEADPQLGEP